MLYLRMVRTNVVMKFYCHVLWVLKLTFKAEYEYVLPVINVLPCFIGQACRFLPVCSFAGLINNSNYVDDVFSNKNQNNGAGNKVLGIFKNFNSFLCRFLEFKCTGTAQTGRFISSHDHLFFQAEIVNPMSIGHQFDKGQ